MSSPLRPLGLIALCTLPASAATLEIDWGTAPVMERLVVSDGTPFNPSSFKIELGGFEAGFTPTASNMGLWVDHWQVFDAITDPDTDPLDFAEVGLPDTGRFAGNAHLESGQTSNSEDATPGATFAAGSQGYLFVRNQDLVGPGAEWGLYTKAVTADGNDAWVFPEVTGSQTQLLLSWILDDADTAVVGAAKDNSISGAGDYTDPSTTFALRTHAIPEPALPALLILAVGLLLRRKRRDQKQT